MGCDIHTYLEYAPYGDKAEDTYWSCFGGRYNPGRDYVMFGIIAGVRYEEAQLFEPKGLPAGNLSYQAEGDAYLILSDEHPELEGYCSMEQASGWGTVEAYGRGDGLRVMHPDLHSHTWLTRSEVAQCIAKRMFEAEYPYDIGWDAILAAMDAFEQRNCQTRLLVWFDN